MANPVTPDGEDTREKYRVREVVTYIVEAASEDDAIEAIVNADNRDEFFEACHDRQAEPELDCTLYHA
jgi:hypothetical protein